LRRNHFIGIAESILYYGFKKNKRMIIKEKAGNLSSFDVAHRSIERVSLEWFEVSKRILHKRTQSGREIVLKFMNEAQSLTHDDVLWSDEKTVIVVDIKPGEVIVVKPTSMHQMASLCYEIGNKHLPLFYSNDEIMVPYEAPLFKLLSAAGYDPKKEIRKLINQLKTTVIPHNNSEGKTSLFTKILQLTTPSANA
jgi:urease accessory protein